VDGRRLWIQRGKGSVGNVPGRAVVGSLKAGWGKGVRAGTAGGSVKDIDGVRRVTRAG
jgi:hypothetical protein